MNANVEELIEEDGVVRGVRYIGADGERAELRALLTIGADGRFSRVRRLAGFEPVKQAPPMDVLWMRLPRDASAQLARAMTLAGAMDLLVEPTLQAAKVPPTEIAVEIAEVLSCLLHELGGVEVAERVGRKIADTAARFLHELSQRPEGVNDRRSPASERLRGHEPERLVASCGHDDGQRVAVERVELFVCDPAEEARDRCLLPRDRRNVDQLARQLAYIKRRARPGPGGRDRNARRGTVALEQRGMKPGNDLADLRIVHDERQVHLRGPLRDEQDIDVANGVDRNVVVANALV